MDAAHDQPKRMPIVSWTAGVLAGVILAAYRWGQMEMPGGGRVLNLASAVVAAISAAAMAYFLYVRRPRRMRGFITTFIFAGLVTAIVRVVLNR
jgi:heme/copper-type cytochrome/quinol oxidase subunit 4